MLEPNCGSLNNLMPTTACFDRCSSTARYM